MSREITVLDGPVGTEFTRRGVATPAPLWSAAVPFVQHLHAAVGDQVPNGAYANAGAMDARIGWGHGGDSASRSLAHAEHWVDAGTTLMGGCCGTDPSTIAALRARWPAAADASHFDTRLQE